MSELIKLFEKLIEYYGHTASTVIMIVMVVLYGAYILLKNYSSIIKRFFENKIKEEELVHQKATLHRKNITPKIRHTLSNLARDVDADRVVLLEFSNGNSNLVGLPFLYISATCEVVKRSVAPISTHYQRVNVSMIAEFLENLECKGYFYTRNISEIALEHPTLVSMMSLNNVHSALFYTIMGVDELIGIIVVTTINDKEFTRDAVLPKTAAAAQVISSYLNFDMLHEEL